MVRAIDAATAKPETGSTINIASVSLHQVANIETNVPNVYLQSPSVNTIIENDLRLAINEGSDSSGAHWARGRGVPGPGTDELIVSVRKAITMLRAAGYNPDTLILTPAADEALDTLVSGIAGGTADFVFAAGCFPGTIFGLSRRVSKTSRADRRRRVRGRQAVRQPGQPRQVRGEHGTTNTSNIRLELNACFGLERVAAAVRIAAS